PVYLPHRGSNAQPVQPERRYRPDRWSGPSEREGVLGCSITPFRIGIKKGRLPAAFFVSDTRSGGPFAVATAVFSAYLSHAKIRSPSPAGSYPTSHRSHPCLAYATGRPRSSRIPESEGKCRQLQNDGDNARARVRGNPSAGGYPRRGCRHYFFRHPGYP